MVSVKPCFISYLTVKYRCSPGIYPIFIQVSLWVFPIFPWLLPRVPAAPNFPTCPAYISLSHLPCLLFSCSPGGLRADWKPALHPWLLPLSHLIPITSPIHLTLNFASSVNPLLSAQTLLYSQLWLLLCGLMAPNRSVIRPCSLGIHPFALESPTRNMYLMMPLLWPKLCKGLLHFHDQAPALWPNSQGA